MATEVLVSTGIGPLGRPKLWASLDPTGERFWERAGEVGTLFALRDVLLGEDDDAVPDGHHALGRVRRFGTRSRGAVVPPRIGRVTTARPVVVGACCTPRRARRGGPRVCIGGGRTIVSRFVQSIWRLEPGGSSCI